MKRGEFQIPNPKFQTNPKLQIPIRTRERFGVEDLEFGSNLGFGIWGLLLLALCSGSLLAAEQPQNSPEPGFQSIFNGHDLIGWDGNPRLWSVKDGAIVGQTTAENPAKGNTFLIWTNGTVADFELRCSFKLTPGDNKNFANSGVQYRSQIVDPTNWVVGGYQADMEAGTNYTGILYEEKMRGIMATRGERVIWDNNCHKHVVGSVGKADEIQAAIKQGDWNDYVIIAQGNHLRQFINGKQTIDVVDQCPAKAAKSGILALQLHAGSPMKVEFRNLRLKTISSSQGEADDMKTIQGAWQVVSSEVNGEPSDEMANSVVTIRNDSWKLVNGDSNDSGKFKIDPSKKPKQMDITRDEGQNLPAIYEVDDNTLRVCYGLEGERPTDFKTSAGSDRALITYKRKKDFLFDQPTKPK